MPKHYRYPVEMKLLSRLIGLHPEEKCAGDICVIHNPTDHHMRTWPMNWRGDRGLIERICKHLVSHPDPDHLPRWEALSWGGQDVHGCCGHACCVPPEKR